MPASAPVPSTTICDLSSTEIVSIGPTPFTVLLACGAGVSVTEPVACDSIGQANDNASAATIAAIKSASQCSARHRRSAVSGSGRRKS